MELECSCMERRCHVGSLTKQQSYTNLFTRTENMCDITRTVVLVQFPLVRVHKGYIPLVRGSEICILSTPKPKQFREVLNLHVNLHVTWSKRRDFIFSQNGKHGVADREKDERRFPVGWAGDMVDKKGYTCRSIGWALSLPGHLETQRIKDTFYSIAGM